MAASPISRHRFYSRDRTAADIAIVRGLDKIASIRLARGGTIESLADLDEQALIAHPGQVTAGNANVREIARSHHSPILGERHCAFSQCRLRSASGGNSGRAVAISLSYLDGGL
jgi:hypothetical protein